MKVYYGWTKINKIQHREAIQVTFENEEGAGYERSRSGKTLRKLMNIVTERTQTVKESADASASNRVFTSYYVFMDDKRINGSLEKALFFNMQADKFNISNKENLRISQCLKDFFLRTHPGYKEPFRELDLIFVE